MLQEFLERIARRGIAATAEALFPENDYGAPDHRTTDLVRRMLDYLGELPHAQRRLLVMLFVVVELGAPLLFFTPHWFSGMRVFAREDGVRALRRSRFTLHRIIGDALKATATMIYMSHTDALAYIGAKSSCARPLDPLQIRTRSAPLVDARSAE